MVFTSQSIKILLNILCDLLTCTSHFSYSIKPKQNKILQQPFKTIKQPFGDENFNLVEEMYTLNSTLYCI